jgi:hypothetical protein
MFSNTQNPRFSLNVSYQISPQNELNKVKVLNISPSTEMKQVIIMNGMVKGIFHS